jgi:cytochrome c oxidase assembly protein subunit 15
MALVVFVYLAWLVASLFRTPGYRGVGVLVGALLLIQVSLGISNVLFSLPIAVAVAHNAGAALLLGSLVLLNYRIRRR